MQVALIDRNLIDFGDRRRDDYGDISQLALSIQEKGLIQPIAVWQKPEGGYLLLAGGRRFKATATLNMQMLPCRIFTDEIDDLLYREIELIENIERKDLTWQESVRMKKEIHELQVAKHGHKVAKGNQHTVDTSGWSVRDTASLLNKSPSSVAADVQLASAVETFPELEKCKTKADATKALAKLKEQMVIEELAKRAEARRSTTGIDGLRTKLRDAYILRDFFEGVKEIPDKCIDFVEIDPPYGVALKETKKGDTEGLDVYNEIDADRYPMFLANLFKECHRVMSENSWMIVWYGPEPWQEIVYKAIRDAGFNTRRIAGIWTKSTGQTMQPDKYLANAYEPFYYASKGSPNLARQGRSNVFAYDPVPPNKKIHPTERPIEMIQEVMSVFCWTGSRVMVPFAGSGNSLLAASNLNLNAFGYDLSKQYRDSYMLRVNDSEPGRYRSYATAEGITFNPIF